MTLNEGIVCYGLCGIIVGAIYRIVGGEKMRLVHLLASVLVWPVLVLFAIICFLDENKI